MTMDDAEYAVLIVDDDRTNRVVAEFTLGKYFNTISVESGEKALEIISNREVAVLLTDQKMPGMSGIDLAERSFEINPDTIRILITAYSDLPMAIEAINRARVNHFVKKPWIQEELVSVVSQSIGQYRNSELIKKLQEEQMRMDRVRSLGILSSGIAHDMRQPLTYIFHFLNTMKRDIKKAVSVNRDAEVEGLLRLIGTDIEDISRGVDVLTTLSKNLLNHINNLPVNYEDFSLREVIKNVISISRYTIKERSSLETQLPENDINMYSCKTRISQILLNLLLNACQSISSGSPDDNRIRLKVNGNGENVIIEVEDTGCGIREELIQKIFEPQFSTKGCGGTGLGLSICKINVEELGGSINVFTRIDSGTTFVVELPIRSSPIANN